jgi:hypothetical protein
MYEVSTGARCRRSNLAVAVAVADNVKVNDHDNVNDNVKVNDD